MRQTCTASTYCDQQLATRCCCDVRGLSLRGIVNSLCIATAVAERFYSSVLSILFVRLASISTMFQIGPDRNSQAKATLSQRNKRSIYRLHLMSQPFPTGSE